MHYNLLCPDQSLLVGKGSVSPSQLGEARDLVEIVEPIELSLHQQTWRGLPHGTAGSYAFLRLGRPCLRIYIGISWEDLLERIRKQRYQRRWAGLVLFFELPGLLRSTLERLERRLLNLGQRWLPKAMWDNVEGVTRGGASPTCSPPFDLDRLGRKIFGHIWARTRYWHEATARLELAPTHQMGDPSGRLHGLLHQQPGGWCRLLPGSRVSVLCPNQKAMERDPAARKVLSKPYWEGTICWRGDRRRQPAGLVVSEAIQFRSRAAAAEFLFAGQAVDDKWAKT
uniref:Uncharacterized protein n=1 Tax=Alloyangia mangrovi TaxID=1779329 RepID=A0A2A3JXM9_9RHOB